ncbi:hypothetical protein D3C71_1854950 [compost metagenome]
MNCSIANVSSRWYSHASFWLLVRLVPSFGSSSVQTLPPTSKSPLPNALQIVLRIASNCFAISANSVFASKR